MTHQSKGRNAFSILLAVVVFASIVVLATACNTSQAPDRQVKDVQITTQVKAKLASDVRASSITNIDVNTTNGVVTLSGQVESHDVARNAETVAESVPGVVRVNNDLQVSSNSASSSQ